MSLFSELRRRNVFKVALVYAVASWLVVWFTNHLILWLGLSDWVGEFVLLVVLIGFPVALIFAWVYEITPEGLKKGVDLDQTQSIVYKTGQKLNAAMAVLAVLGLALVFGEKLMPEFVLPPPVVIEEIPLRPTFDFPEDAKVPRDIKAFTLPNGMKIIVWPDHDIPNVALYNFVRAGGRNEYPGITGLAHFFEHMMFNGTKKHPAGEFDRLMEAAGGANNAYTTNDVTVYTDWFPKSALETVVALEADRLRYLAIDPAVVESERGVVYSERRLRVDNDVFGQLYEQVFATAYMAHPYQFPVIGWPSDIENWSQADLESFFRRYYAPNNCTLVFVGDVTDDEVYALAKRHLSRIPAQDPPPEVRTVEPEQTGERRLVIETDVSAPLLHVAFHGGAAGDPLTLQMEVLLQIVAAGDASRLHQVLVEEEGLALSIDAWQSGGFDPGLVYFYLTLPPNAEVAAVESRLLEELDRIIAEGVTPAELQRAHNTLVADFWRELQTINGKAQALGWHDVFTGDYENLFARPRLVSAVTAAELQSAAARVFRRSNMTVGVLRAPLAGDES